MFFFRRVLKQSLYIALLLTIIIGNAQTDSSRNAPLRLTDLLQLPKSLRLSLNHQIRYEFLDNPFLPTQPDNDEILVLRTLLEASYRYKNISFTGEFGDSRQYLATIETPVTTAIVNTFAVIQAYISIDIPKLFGEHNNANIKVGRFTMNLGNRRLIARNVFRNTITNFTGIYTQFLNSKLKIHSFYVLPVSRLPSSRNLLLNNNAQLDRQSFDQQFWGVFTEIPALFKKVSADFTLLGLHEKEINTNLNRDLIVSSIRVFRKPKKGTFDFELESVFQLGNSRASTAPIDNVNLNHFAHFQHAQLGYTFASKWSPRILLQLDYASGDQNPNDNRNNRFDPIFGVPRIDFGPTGIFRPFIRSNLVSPGIRLITNPNTRLDFLLANRFYWLASNTDALTTSGLRDSNGNSGSFLGNETEFRLRWYAIPQIIRLELGAAHFFSGNFIRRASSSTVDDTSYFYVQTTFKL